MAENRATDGPLPEEGGERSAERVASLVRTASLLYTEQHLDAALLVLDAVRALDGASVEGAVLRQRIKSEQETVVRPSPATADADHIPPFVPPGADAALWGDFEERIRQRRQHTLEQPAAGPLSDRSAVRTPNARASEDAHRRHGGDSEEPADGLELFAPEGERHAGSTTKPPNGTAASAATPLIADFPSEAASGPPSDYKLRPLRTERVTSPTTVDRAPLTRAVDRSIASDAGGPALPVTATSLRVPPARAQRGIVGALCLAVIALVVWGLTGSRLPHRGSGAAVSRSRSAPTPDTAPDAQAAEQLPAGGGVVQPQADRTQSIPKDQETAAGPPLRRQDRPRPLASVSPPTVTPRAPRTVQSGTAESKSAAMDDAPSAPSQPMATSGTVRATPADGDAPDRDRAAVRQVLNSYQAAYVRLDANAVASIWPQVPVDDLARAFRTVRSQDVSFDQCSVSVNGTAATAQCIGRIFYVPAVGGAATRIKPLLWRFILTQRQGIWLIDRMSTE